MPIAHTDASPVYLDTAHAIAQLGDADALPPMLAMLEESLARDVPQITALLDSGDVPGANRLLHPMKGFLPIFCGDALCAELSAVEGLSKTPSSTEVAPAYAALRPKLDQLLAEVVAFLKNHGATSPGV
jgi:HPt (histidine-containing phosphotransfer) domain-containing protein